MVDGYLNDRYDQQAIRAKVRLAFYSHRTLQMIEEIVPQSAQLLKLDKLLPIAEDEKLYPPKNECDEIIRLDTVNEQAQLQDYETMKATMTAQGLGNFVPTLEAYRAGMGSSVYKDRTFHYLPYDFTQSAFEKTFLTESLKLTSLHDKGLEIFYNGERSLTEFKIICYEKTARSWRKVGGYTPDFLILQREDSAIKKILIVETKGVGYAAQDAFIKRKKFVQEHFIPFNNEQFGYERFDFLYISDNDKGYLVKVEQKIAEFFEELK